MQKILLVGCGEHSLENLIPSLASIPNAQVVAVCDPEPMAQAAAARWFPSAAKHGEYSAALLLNATAVVVAATPQVHERVARDCIAAGKPIFLEKPPTITTAALTELAIEAERKAIVTCVGHNLRHSLHNRSNSIRSLSRIQPRRRAPVRRPVRRHRSR